ncbi:hypothetical protein [Zeimonas arvi]|nr:hypothetical protein [Zeimonas arvi]
MPALNRGKAVAALIPIISGGKCPMNLGKSLIEAGRFRMIRAFPQGE